jgi:O-antigen biosynthesis protein WbqP
VKRSFDVLLAIVLGTVLLLPCLIIGVLVRASSRGPALYWSDRVGKQNRIFRMPKFRSMYVGTPSVATHLLHDATNRITPVGAVLRRTSLDELPQLWSVLKGDMSFVGPRPALFNQDDLVSLRTRFGVHHLRPGITGWAQINGRDELDVSTKVRYDVEYLQRRSTTFDLLILWLTVWRVCRREGVAH